MPGLSSLNCPFKIIYYLQYLRNDILIGKFYEFDSFLFQPLFIIVEIRLEPQKPVIIFFRLPGLFFNGLEFFSSQ